MAPKYHCFRNYSRLYNVPGIPSEEEENALTDAAFEAFQGARQIEIRPSGTGVESAMFWRRTPHYENVMKEQREDFMRRIAGTGPSMNRVILMKLKKYPALSWKSSWQL